MQHVGNIPHASHAPNAFSLLIKEDYRRVYFQSVVRNINIRAQPYWLSLVKKRKARHKVPDLATQFIN